MWGAIAAILLAPLAAMQFTSEVDWGPEDFLFAGLLLAAAGGLFELAVRLTRKTAHRAVLGALLLGVVLLIWAEAAVGVF